MSSGINYQKLSTRELKELISKHDQKAEDEYDRRVFSGEIKLKKYTLKEIHKMYRTKKAS